MVKFLIQRPVAVFMVSLAFFVLGIVALLSIPTSLMPNIPIPEVTVQISYPNNTAREIETNVTRPLRNQLLQVSNLKDISTETRDGFATLKLIFEYGTNTDYAFIETNEKVDAALNFLPKNLDRPRVIKASSTDIPIVNLTVSLKETYNDERFIQLSEFTETILKKRVEQLPNIALADISGYIEGEIIVIPNKNTIEPLGISNDQISNAIQQNNLELGNLIIQNGAYQFNFKFSNPLRSLEDIENIYLNIEGRILQLKEIAQVQLKPQKKRGSTFYNGNRCITLAIIKQADAKVYKLQEDLENLINILNIDYPDLVFNTNQDQTKLLKLSIDNLKSSLWIGGSLAILIMFFFLKEIKSPLIIAISIPISLLLSILFMYVANISINIISLSGLILGVGMMIDNAIIVIDNITQKLEEGASLFDACVNGTSEIITPLISSVLTTCSVFLPLLFLSGITGALFYDQALAVSIGLVASLLVSIIIIPVIYKQLHNRNFNIEKWFLLNIRTQRIEILYEKGYVFFLNNKWIVYSISFIGILLAVYFLKTMPYSQLPNLKEKEIIVNIDWNENINVSENEKRIQEITDSISQIEVKYSQIAEQQFILQQNNSKSFSEATIYIKALSLKDLAFIKKQIEKDIQIKFPKAHINFEPPKTIFQYIFGVNQSKITAQVYSKSNLELPEINALPEINDLLNKKSSTSIPTQQTTIIEILHENLLLYEIDNITLINELKTLFGENNIDDLKTAKKFIPIKLSYETTYLKEKLNSVFIKNKKRASIPLKNLINIRNIEQYKTITSDRRGEYLDYKINSTTEIQEEVYSLQKIFRESDYNVRFSGSWFDINSLSKELVIVALLAFLLLYFIMASQFESLWQPLIILLEIPIDIGGALLLLWIFGGTINIMAAIGIVVMSGVIINDSILKLHTINTLRKKGLTIEEAIKLGGKLRLKPIIMTSLTTILALLPFLFIQGLGASLQRPLALTVIGGMIIGTFISLYFIPLMYSLLAKKFSL